MKGRELVKSIENVDEAVYVYVILSRGGIWVRSHKVDLITGILLHHEDDETGFKLEKKVFSEGLKVYFLVADIIE